MSRNVAAGLALALSLTLFASGTRAQSYRPRPDINSISGKYTPQIASLASSGQHRKAIAKVGEYEQEILSLYEPPSYKMGLFQCEAEHLNFHSPFVEWKLAEKKAEEDEFLKKLTMTGWNFLLALEGGSEAEGLTVFCVHAGRLAQRMGLQEMKNELSSDHALLQMSQMFVSSFGVVKSHRFQTLGDHRVLCLEVRVQGVGPEFRMVLLPAEERIFGFLLVSPYGDITVNEQRLHELVKTASFDYKPEDEAAITAARAEVTRPSVESLLACVDRLAELGEFNAAAEDLTRLRHLLWEQMPKATVRDEVGSCPAYGITFKNPDPARWRLNVETDGVFQGLSLEDKFSVQQEGVLVGVVDLLVVFGPQVVQMTSNDDELAKQTLIGTGRGMATSQGEVQDERLVPIQGALAYEATVTANLPGVKGRVQCIDKKDHFVVILLLGSGQRFEEKKAEYDGILANCLQLGSPSAEAAPCPVNSGFTWR